MIVTNRLQAVQTGSIDLAQSAVTIESHGGAMQASQRLMFATVENLKYPSVKSDLVY